MTIPVEVADITPAWLTRVLRAHEPDLAVRRVEVLAAHSGTTGRARVHLEADHAASIPRTLFLKLAPFDARQREFVRRTGLGVSEARLYATLGGELPVRVPRVWHAEVDAEGRYVMVLEDLVASGCRFPRVDDRDLAERAAALVDALGALHARFWESPRFAGDLAWVPERAGFGGRGTDPASVRAASDFARRALGRFADTSPAVYRTVRDLYVEHTAAVLDAWDEGERTLVHGDPHIGNLFDDGPDVGLLDWAMTSRSPGVRDVAYFCCGSLPPPLRREIETELLARYRARLAAAGIGTDAAAVLEQYRLFAVFAWVSAASTAAVGSRWQPAPSAIAAMQRATTALEDLDAPGILAERIVAAAGPASADR